MSPSDSQIILFHYSHSPFSSRVLYYLTLRGIPYDECLQPRILPRPDLARLGIKYRRIPLLSIGRDVYFDSRLIIDKLEQLDFPHPPLSGSLTPEQCGIAKLLGSFTTDTNLFFSIVQVLLPMTPMIRDKAFLEDRADGANFNFDDAILATRPDAINTVRNAVELLETTFLADGREWLLKTEEPSLADIEAVWSLGWLFSTPGALPEEHISASLFPRVFAWVERFQVAVKAKREALRVPETLEGEKVAEILGKLAYATEDGVDESDPLVQQHGLKKGQLVQVWPTDFGTRHKTVGALVGLNRKEVTIETTEGDVSVRVHAPRHGFQLAAVTSKPSKLS